jgi:hypothetical protein
MYQGKGRVIKLVPRMVGRPWFMVSARDVNGAELSTKIANVFVVSYEAGVQQSMSVRQNWRLSR